MSSLNLNGPKKRKGNIILSIVMLIIFIFLFCLVFYEVNQIKDENKNYKKENEKYESKVKELEKQVNTLKEENKNLSTLVKDCTNLEKARFTLQEGVYIEFISNNEYKEVNGTTEITGKYTFKDNIVTNYLENTMPYYYIVSQDCKNLYKINYEKNEIFTYKANES